MSSLSNNNKNIHHTFDVTSLQTHHMDSTLKRRENDRFDIVSRWNPRGVFVWLMVEVNN